MGNATALKSGEFTAAHQAALSIWTNPAAYQEGGPLHLGSGLLVVGSQEFAIYAGGIQGEGVGKSVIGINSHLTGSATDGRDSGMKIFRPGVYKDFTLKDLSNTTSEVNLMRIGGGDNLGTPGVYDPNGPVIEFDNVNVDSGSALAIGPWSGGWVNHLRVKDCHWMLDEGFDFSSFGMVEILGGSFTHQGSRHLFSDNLKVRVGRGSDGRQPQFIQEARSLTTQGSPGRNGRETGTSEFDFNEESLVEDLRVVSNKLVHRYGDYEPPDMSQYGPRQFFASEGTVVSVGAQELVTNVRWQGDVWSDAQGNPAWIAGMRTNQHYVMVLEGKYRGQKWRAVPTGTDGTIGIDLRYGERNWPLDMEVGTRISLLPINKKNHTQRRCYVQGCSASIQFTDGGVDCLYEDNEFYNCGSAILVCRTIWEARSAHSRFTHCPVWNVGMRRNAFRVDGPASQSRNAGIWLYATAIHQDQYPEVIHLPTPFYGIDISENVVDGQGNDRSDQPLEVSKFDGIVVRYNFQGPGGTTSPDQIGGVSIGPNDLRTGQLVYQYQSNGGYANATQDMITAH